MGRSSALTLGGSLWPVCQDREPNDEVVRSALGALRAPIGCDGARYAPPLVKQRSLTLTQGARARRFRAVVRGRRSQGLIRCAQPPPTEAVIRGVESRRQGPLRVAKTACLGVPTLGGSL